MKTTDYIESKIARLPNGYVFTYLDFITGVNSKEAIIKALNRMVASGKIAKLSKGKFYKPESSEFGNLQPNQYQTVKDLLDNDGKSIGYLTGYSIYNLLGLTTQVSNIIQIGKNEVRPAFKRKLYKIAFVRQKNTITKDNIELLQILDALRYIKKIPDVSITSALIRFLAILKGIPANDKIRMVKLALKYPPSTRALLGALLDENGNSELTEPLKNSLNPITVYELTGINKVLTTTEKWNIKNL